MNSLKNKYYWILLFTGFLYSSLAFFTKFLDEQKVDPFNQVFWRITIALIGSTLLSIFVYKQNFKISRKELKLIAANSVIFVYGFITWALAVYFGSPITKAISLVFAYPVWISFFTYLVFKQLPSRKNVIAMILALVSINLILEIWNVENVTDIGVGDVFAILNSIAYAALIVWGGKIRKSTELHPVKALNFTLLFAIPILLVTKIILGELGVEAFSAGISTSFEVSTWLTFLGIGLLATVGTLVLIYNSIKHVSPNVASILLTTELFWVYIFGLIFFGEMLYLSGILGTIGMIISVLLI